MSLLSLNSTALQALSIELADIAQRYNHYSGASLKLRQYQTCEGGEESIYVIGEDEQGREWIAVKVSQTLSPADRLRLKVDLQHTDTQLPDTHQNNNRRFIH
jgi:hypothetical protein